MTAPPNVLILEDDVLIALDLAEIVELSGCRVLGPFRRAVDALGALGRERPDLALIDFDLGGHTSAPVAARLVELEIPAAVISGHPPSALPDVFEGLDFLSKPLLQEHVEQMIERSCVGEALPPRATPQQRAAE